MFREERELKANLRRRRADWRRNARAQKDKRHWGGHQKKGGNLLKLPNMPTEKKEVNSSWGGERLSHAG